jgi:hypothetical protein
VNTPETMDFIGVLRRDGPINWSRTDVIDWQAVIDELGDGPYSANVFQAAAKFPDLAAAQSAIRALVRGVSDPGAAQEIVAVVCAGFLVPAELLEPLFEDLEHVSFRGNAHYGVRSATLKGALYLSQGRASWQYRLQGQLLEIKLTDDPHFLRHAANVISIFASIRPEPHFIELLRQLSSIPEASDEAAVGLGAVLLAQALGTPTRDEALSLFSESRSWFALASLEGADRADAKLFSDAVGILLDFGNEANGSKIAGSVEAIKTNLFEHLSIVLDGDGRPPDKSWIGLRTTELAHWATLSVKISQLTESLKRDVWLDVVRVIEEQLFHILTASRTIFNRGRDGGVEAVTGPLIKTEFLKRKSHLSMLDEWLEQREQSPWRDKAMAFRTSIRAELDAAVLRSPFDAADVSSISAALKSIEGISDRDKEELDAISAAAEREFSFQANDPLANDILRGMLARLLGNADFVAHKVARNLFLAILQATIKFVIHCDNVQTSKMTAYLFVAKKPPVEKDLQMHYMSAIDQSPLQRIANLEPQGVGGGRADVQFKLAGFTLVTECKRTFKDMKNEESLLSFGGQVAGYQASNVSFSALLILDLYDRGGGAQNFRDRISVETANPHGDREFSVAVFRVQGHRRPPSKLKLSSMTAKRTASA